ncbi:NAD-dependent epimerase/dehydratase family protein [Pseudooctadecabacter jejudonensis]|uniref:dTDP-glucose 4,6-dehydratase n=1 Tax=Pseudooctadecabacter jejudonensis TaxID=1391910 RepID=A0A1Y5SJU1_9RHOB|nr:NAD(P)-dependent oxidoreductase [Pseudooctadecabacter jejudonensis]SLN39333.1 dTDP-glucose 4,6-dehydratase [Pseudooctadecabacter jejudonensis]
MRVFFTGGSGKAGRYAIQELQAAGHTVVNIDQVPCGLPDTPELLIDLTDPGQVMGAMTQWADFDEMEDAPRAYDAVVHFAAVPRVMIGDDGSCFRANVASTYNVIEAAYKLGVPKVIFASSETTYGVCFAQGEVKPAYVPVDEDHPTVPHDSYAMSKVCNEATARSFQARAAQAGRAMDIYGLRINNVIEPHEYVQNFPAFVADPALRRRNIFAYIDARDLGQMVNCCLATDGLGYEVFNVANEDSSVGMPSVEVAETFYAGVPVKGDLGGHTTFYAIDKAKKMVGFAPEHGWRDLV